MWIIDLFAVNIKDNNLIMNEKESLIDLSYNDNLKAKLNSSFNYQELIFGSTLKVNIHC